MGGIKPVRTTDATDSRDVFAQRIAVTVVVDEYAEFGNKIGVLYIDFEVVDAFRRSAGGDRQHVSGRVVDRSQGLTNPELTGRNKLEAVFRPEEMVIGA